MPLDLPKPPAWLEDAACIGHPPELWDTKTAIGPGTRAHREVEVIAKAICNGCPVRLRCLDDAMRCESGSHQMRATIRGGLTPGERAALERGAVA